MLTEQECLDLGFEKITHFTIGNNLVYNLGRGRTLSLSCVGTPYEMLFIKYCESNNTSKEFAIIILHNYDLDGFLTKDKLMLLLNFFKKQ